MKREQRTPASALRKLRAIAPVCIVSHRRKLVDARARGG